MSPPVHPIKVTPTARRYLDYLGYFKLFASHGRNVAPMGRDWPNLTASAHAAMDVGPTKLSFTKFGNKHARRGYPVQDYEIFRVSENFDGRSIFNFDGIHSRASKVIGV